MPLPFLRHDMCRFFYRHSWGAMHERMEEHMRGSWAVRAIEAEAFCNGHGTIQSSKTLVEYSLPVLTSHIAGAGRARGS